MSPTATSTRHRKPPSQPLGGVDGGAALPLKKLPNGGMEGGAGGPAGGAGGRAGGRGGSSGDRGGGEASDTHIAEPRCSIVVTLKPKRAEALTSVDGGNDGSADSQSAIEQRAARLSSLTFQTDDIRRRSFSSSRGKRPWASTSLVEAAATRVIVRTSRADAPGRRGGCDGGGHGGGGEGGGDGGGDGGGGEGPLNSSDTTVTLALSMATPMMVLRLLGVPFSRVLMATPAADAFAAMISVLTCILPPVTVNFTWDAETENKPASLAIMVSRGDGEPALNEATSPAICALNVTTSL